VHPYLINLLANRAHGIVIAKMKTVWRPERCMMVGTLTIIIFPACLAVPLPDRPILSVSYCGWGTMRIYGFGAFQPWG
jgi:hypothetical protein